MPIIIAEGVVEVTGDGTKVPGQVARDIDANGAPVEQAGQGMGRKLIGGLVAIGAVAGVTNWLSGAVSGASDLNETISKGTAIFGDAMPAIKSFGENAAVNVGMSEAAAIGAAASFGDMFSQIGFTTDAAAAMSQQVVIAAADLGSFSNLETADVADRMSAAFRGEYDSLQAVIPNINAARVESEALAATGKTVASELTAQEKAAAVLAIVQKDGARAMGDFARTSDGLANQTKISTAQLADMQAEVGTALLPTMQGFMGFVLSDVIPTFTAMAGWVGENIELLKGIGIAVLAAGGAWLVMTGALAVYNGVMGIVKAVTIAGSVATWALNTAMAANPIGLIITLFALLVGAIVWVATQTTFFQDVWRNATTAIGVAWQWVWGNVISPVANFIGGAIINVGNTIRNVFGGIGAFIGSAFQSVLGVVRGPLNALIGLINNVIGGLNSIRVTIPAWVPLVGGNTFGLSIPRLPMLARGTNNAPGAFIAGEAGPELITGARGATVRPYGVTTDLLARGSGGGSDEWRAVTELLAKLIEAVKEIPGAQVNLKQEFPDTEAGIVKARQTAREIVRYLGV
jgi:hypothetical protein